MILIGKFKDIKFILEQAVKAGYGKLPAVYAVKFYLERN